jgi:hypothetical protein
MVNLMVPCTMMPSQGIYSTSCAIFLGLGLHGGVGDSDSTYFSFSQYHGYHRGGRLSTLPTQIPTLNQQEFVLKLKLIWSIKFLLYLHFTLTVVG